MNLVVECGEGGFVCQDVLWDLLAHTLSYLTPFNESRAAFGCDLFLIIN